MIGRILICGDRNWTDYQSIREVVCILASQYGTDIAVIHGAARGADDLAGRAALSDQLTVWAEPAKWERDGKAAGPIRNQLMLDRYKPHLVIAFHPDLKNSKGTGHMVKIALAASVPVVHIRNRQEAENIANELPESLHP